MTTLPISEKEYTARCLKAVPHSKAKKPMLLALIERLWEYGPAQSIWKLAPEIGVSHPTAGKWIKFLEEAGLYYDVPVRQIIEEASSGKPISDPKANLDQIVERIKSEPSEEARNRYIARLEEEMERSNISARDLATIVGTIAQIRPNIKAPEKQVNITYLVGKESLEQTRAELTDDLKWLVEHEPDLLLTPEMEPVRRAFLSKLPAAEAEVEDADESDSGTHRESLQAGDDGVHPSSGSDDSNGRRRGGYSGENLLAWNEGSPDEASEGQG